MPHYKSLDKSVHFIETKYEYMLPAGSVEITDAEAAELLKQPEIKPDPKVQRLQAYQLESDPLFFQEQRGSVPEGTWLAKVEEIKLRYPIEE